MKNHFLWIIVSLLIGVSAVSPRHSSAAVDNYNLADLQHQLNKAKEDLSRTLAIQSKDMKKELERLKREIERIYKEIEEELKKAQVVIQQEDRNLKQYLVKYKIEVEQIKVEIDSNLKTEKIKANLEGESSKFDIAQSQGLWKKIGSENILTAKPNALPATKTTIQPVVPVKLQEPVLEPEKKQVKNLAKIAEGQTRDGDGPEIAEKLSKLSLEIIKAKEALESGSGNTKKLWVDLAKANLEGERFLKSLDSKVRHQYVNSDQYVLGSYEVAILSFKQALSSNSDDPDLNYLLGEVYDEVNDGLSASNHAELARLQYLKKGKRVQAAKAKEYARDLKNKYNIGQDFTCGMAVITC